MKKFPKPFVEKLSNLSRVSGENTGGKGRHIRCPWGFGGQVSPYWTVASSI